MKKKITEVESLTSLDGVTSFFVNDGEDIKQIDVKTIKEGDETRIQLEKLTDIVLPRITAFDYEEIKANEKYHITEAGLYLFTGNDYFLNFYNYDYTGTKASLIGKGNNLINVVFVAKNHNDSNYLRAFYGKTYKGSLGVSTMESGAVDLLNLSRAQAYIHNADSSNSAFVYYLKPYHEG